MEGSTAYGILNSKIKGLASGFDHATKTGDNTFDIYFIDGSKVSITIPEPTLDYDKIGEQIESMTEKEIEKWLGQSVTKSELDVKLDDYADKEYVNIMIGGALNGTY